MTFKSCKAHNNEKTKDEIYVLANIFLNSIREDKSDAHEVFKYNVKPQLMHNNETLLKKILRNLSNRDETASKFEVDSSRLDYFFDCLTHGVLYKKVGKKVDAENYAVRHMYMNLEQVDGSGNLDQGHLAMKLFWKQNLLDDQQISEVLEFKSEAPKGYSTEIYSVRFMIGEGALIKGSAFTVVFAIASTTTASLAKLSLCSPARDVLAASLFAGGDAQSALQRGKC